MITNSPRAKFPGLPWPTLCGSIVMTLWSRRSSTAIRRATRGSTSLWNPSTGWTKIARDIALKHARTRVELGTILLADPAGGTGVFAPGAAKSLPPGAPTAIDAYLR